MRILALLGASVLLCLSTVTIAAGSKVEVCHVPPGNTANFHTITVSEKALSAHLAHGDLVGACNQMCATLCDDGNACTIDDTDDCEQNGCPVVPKAVSCDDVNACTYDTCDPLQGCINDPAPLEGQLCDDNQVCSSPDQCNGAGECVGLPIDSCCVGNDDCSQDQCDQAVCDLDTNRCEDAPVQCNPSDLCQVSMCAPDDGNCYETPIICAEGETCSPSTGECEADQLECSDIDESYCEFLGFDCTQYSSGEHSCTGEWHCPEYVVKRCTDQGYVDATCNRYTYSCIGYRDICTPFRQQQCLDMGLEPCEPDSYACVP